LKSHQHLFFSFIDYSSEVFNGTGSISLKSLTEKKITLITGIANPQPLLDHLQREKIEFEHMQFPDHYNFKEKDMANVSGEIILTTEKDFMRLKSIIYDPRLFYIPISQKFIKEEDKFQMMVDQYILNEK